VNAIDRAFILAYQKGEPSKAPAVAAELPGRQRTSTSVAALLAAAPRQEACAGTAPAAHPPAPANERRPLSAFAAPPRIVDGRFKPALEVDQLDWPRVCLDLMDRHEACFWPALDAVCAAQSAGRSLIGVAGAAPGAGCTTLLLCLARLLVSAGRSVALVDGNFAAPGLARSLRLVPDAGWEDSLSGRLPLAECIVQSLADRMAVLPLVAGGETAATALGSIQASITAGVLRYHYDVVLVDLGVVAGGWQAAAARQAAQQCRLDGAILAAVEGRTTAADVRRVLRSSPELAAICLGVVENETHAA
jgi:Mrp family chromosome partitioning ATPase